MSRKNSISLFALKATVEPAGNRGVLVTLHQPAEEDLIRIVAQASSLLEWRQKRAEILQAAP